MFILRSFVYWAPGL